MEVGSESHYDTGVIENDDLYWLAGLLEGEGWFGTSRSRQGKHYPRITVNMCDRDVIERIAKLFGTNVNGPYKYRTNKSSLWYTSANGVKAVQFMRLLYPLLHERRQTQIVKVFDLCETGTEA